MTVMSTKKDEKPVVDPVHEISMAFDGEIIERMVDLLYDPGADHTAGQLARMGAAFAHIGVVLTDAAKTIAAKSSIDEDAGVTFIQREPSSQTRVNTKLVKEKFPPAEFPTFWQDVPVKGSVAVELPHQFKS